MYLNYYYLLSVLTWFIRQDTERLFCLGYRQLRNTRLDLLPFCFWKLRPTEMLECEPIFAFSDTQRLLLLLQNNTYYSFNILFMLVLQLFFQVFMPLKVFSITCISQMFPETPPFPTCYLIYKTFHQLFSQCSSCLLFFQFSQLILFSLDVLQTLRPISLGVSMAVSALGSGVQACDWWSGSWDDSFWV